MVFLLLGLTAAIAEGGATCPAGTTVMDTFSAEGKQWAACEDLSMPGGGLTLVPQSGLAIHLPKSHEPYSPEPDENYYLGLGKQAVLGAKWDMLGDAILHGCANETPPHALIAPHPSTPQPLSSQPSRCVWYRCDDDSRTPTTGLCEPTWRRVERALPVMRYSRGDRQASGNRFMCSPYSPESGVRTFTGSRSASVDATFSDHADDCTDNGFPRPQALRPLAPLPTYPRAPPHVPLHPLTFACTPLSPYTPHLLTSHPGYVMNLTWLYLLWLCFLWLY